MARNRWQRKARLSSAKAREMGRASQAVQREKRDADLAERVRELAEIEVQNLPRKQGDALGLHQWTDFATGQTRRWIVRIGDRADRITLESPQGKRTGSHGWTWALDHLRGFLCGNKQGTTSAH